RRSTGPARRPTAPGSPLALLAAGVRALAAVGERPRGDGPAGVASQGLVELLERVLDLLRGHDATAHDSPAASATAPLNAAITWSGTRTSLPSRSCTTSSADSPSVTARSTHTVPPSSSRIVAISTRWRRSPGSSPWWSARQPRGHGLSAGRWAGTSVIDLRMDLFS